MRNRLIRRSGVRVMGTLAALCLLVSLRAPAAPAAETPEQAAQAAAQSWLLLVDADRYAESWRQAASFFRQQVSAEQWESAVRSVHALTGKIASRKLKSAQFAKSLPNAPEGEYVVLQYDSSFEKMKGATETVTPMKDKDGAWRVAGYFVK